MKKFVIESVKFISMITAGFLAVIIFAGVIIFGLNGFVSDLPQLETQISTPIPNLPLRVISFYARLSERYRAFPSHISAIGIFSFFIYPWWFDSR